MGAPPPPSDDPATELPRLRRELERLRHDNAELRARAVFDAELGSDAARYEVIVHHLAEGVVLQGADGQILACNPAAERILGLTVEQMTGRSSLDPRWRAIHEDGAPFPGETHPAMVCLTSGRPVHGVIMGVHKPDGSLTWISITSQPLARPGEARPHAAVTSFVDITPHKEAEARAVVATNAQSDLRRREADIAVRNVRPDHPDLVARKVRDMGGHLYAATAYLDRLGRPRDPAGFADADFIGFDLEGAGMIALLRARGFPVGPRNLVLACDNQLVQWELVRHGLGIGVNADVIGDAEAGVERILPAMEPILFPVWVVSHRELHTSRRVRHVFDLLVEALAAV